MGESAPQFGTTPVLGSASPGSEYIVSAKGPVACLNLKLKPVISVLYQCGHIDLHSSLILPFPSSAMSLGGSLSFGGGPSFGQQAAFVSPPQLNTGALDGRYVPESEVLYRFLLVP